MTSMFSKPSTGDVELPQFKELLGNAALQQVSKAKTIDHGSKLAIARERSAER
jgi:hypothetical protein